MSAINSRSLEDLLPPARARFGAFLNYCADDPWLKKAGVTVLVTSTFRNDESQAELYAQGRTKPGKIVTNAQPGESWHNWKCAGDIVPLRHGKPIWGTTGDGIDDNPADDDRDDLEVWQRIGEIGERCGLEWAGRWVKFREYPHFQYTGGLTLADFKAGKRPGMTA